MIVYPNAKINLGLHVLRKRSDGFHDIESLMLPIPLQDKLEMSVSPGLSRSSLEVTGIPLDGSPEDNLVLKAFRLLQDEYELPHVQLKLEKVIPHGAGLGGGSADAAYMLLLANRFFELGLPAESLEGYAARLGSDCPFFIRNQPALAGGRGEILSPLEVSLEGNYLVLFHPPVHISTPGAYRHMHPNDQRPPLQELLKQAQSEWKVLIENDFERYVFEKHPSMAGLKADLYRAGAWYASLSGSGSAMYGLFATVPPESLLSRADFLLSYKM